MFNCKLLLQQHCCFEMEMKQYHCKAFASIISVHVILFLHAIAKLIDRTG